MVGAPHPGRSPTRAWTSGPVGLAPLAGIDEAHGLVVAGALNLTNAADLARVLNLGRESACRPAHVLLAAYLRWGERLPERLDGDFAFVLWDGRRRLALCARDALGVEPLYYHLSPAVLAVADDAGALLRLPDVPRRLNAQALAAYVAASFEDRVGTGFADVRRLAPGQAMVVDGQRSTLRTYWAPDPAAELRLNGDAAYEEAFRSALTQAVASRVLGSAPVGVSLSGGLDSSALACVASPLASGRLHAYTAVFDADAASDERAWAAAVVKRCGAAAHHCSPARASPLADWAGSPWKGVAPACTPQVWVCRATLEAAAGDGVAVVLHGFGGDSVVSHGLAYLAQLVRRGHLLRALAESERLSRRHAMARRRVLAGYAFGPVLPVPVRRAWSRARPGRGEHPQGLLRPEVARRFGLDVRSPGPPPPSARHDHAAEVTAGIQSHVLESSHRVDAAVGVTRRYPFFDRRLVELCLSLPGDQKLRHGWTRSILRRALAGVLPEEVRQRAGKANLAPPFVRALATADRAALQAVVSDPGALGEWVDPSVLAGLWHQARAGGSERDWFALWRVAVASRWLAHHGFDPGTG